ncbi:MAG: hypothetical protein ACTMIR_01390 [Cellulomonadaceae bacterium]
MVLARALRNLFNRPESVTLLTTLYGDERPYWQSVLEYCANGSLQAVLDEYLFQLHSESGSADLDDGGLLDIASHADDAMTLARDDQAIPALGAVRAALRRHQCDD